MTELKKYGTTRNGWCPPTHVFRSKSYLWSSRRVTVLFLHPVPYRQKIGKLNYINHKFNTNQIMATKTPSHHQVILKHEKLMNTIWKQYVCTQTHQRPISSKFATPCCCNTMLKNCRMNKKLGDTQNNVNKKPFSPSSITKTSMKS